MPRAGTLPCPDPSSVASAGSHLPSLDIPTCVPPQNAPPFPALSYALGSNASGLAVGAFSAPLAGSTLAWPSAMEGAVLTTGSVMIAVTIMTDNDND